MKLLPALFATLFFIVAGADAEPELLLYGGENNKKFLGCLNCNKFDSSSVWNKYGTYGSKFNGDSIWNKFGTYGSKFSVHSPWNRYSTDGPIIVDKRGNSYGYFTSNRYSNQTNIKWAVWILDNYDSVVENFDDVARRIGTN
jgi:hypothetical protein|tara:strand:+ start:64 stop:489 length:426 start_codon:yes stop_codon:yes gene_type:complete